MSSKKYNLNEDLKKFRMLLEYDFYVPENYEELEGKSLMGEDDPADEDDSLGDAPTSDAGDEAGDSFGDSEDGGSDDPMGDDPMASDDTGDAEPVDYSGEADPAAAPAPAPAPQEDEVELDVTQLVQGTEQAKSSADMANQQITNLNQKFDALTAQLSNMSVITKKIDDLEHEVEKRMPTEKEKLEMRSLSSYPYNLKLTDYWADKEGQYDVMGNDGQREPKEYVLTQDDINADYNPIAVKDSFDSDEYEEEDI